MPYSFHYFTTQYISSWVLVWKYNLFTKWLTPVNCCDDGVIDIDFLFRILILFTLSELKEFNPNDQKHLLL